MRDGNTRRISVNCRETTAQTTPMNTTLKTSANNNNSKRLQCHAHVQVNCTECWRHRGGARRLSRANQNCTQKPQRSTTTTTTTTKTVCNNT